MKKFEWRCVNQNNEPRIVAVWANEFVVAEEKVCDYCNENGLTPIDYLGYVEEK